jgi:hypothetical protein
MVIKLKIVSKAVAAEGRGPGQARVGGGPLSYMAMSTKGRGRGNTPSQKY